MGGMVKTTVYLPEELKAALARTAAATGRSEADLIRDGIASIVAAQEPPEPRPLFSHGGLARRVDELLEGFGED
jgi:hypothetical protein